MTISQIIQKDNKTTKTLYPGGQNHRGQKLAFYEVGGYKIWAINADHAQNIYHQATIDAN